MMNPNVTITEEGDIGGILYLNQNGDIYIPYIVFYSLGVVIGCTGNPLIISAILTTKELHNNPTNMLIFNLSLADLVVSGLVDTMTIAGVLIGRKWFLSVHVFCEFIAAACLIACATSMVNICFLAFNRYINICHHKYYNKIFSFRKTLMYCFLTWCVGLLVDLPNILGWGRHKYSVTTLSCLWDRTASHGYNLFFPLSTIVIPCCGVLFFYVKIFIYVRKAKNKIQPVAIFGGSRKNTQNQIQIAKGLFSAFALFTIAWLPYGLVVMTDWNLSYPISSEMYTLLLAHLNSAASPILYALYNPGFRKGYRNVLNYLTGKKRPEKDTLDRTNVTKMNTNNN